MSSTFNPYAPPQAELASAGLDSVAGEALEVASRWRRFLGFLVDYVCFIAASFVVGIVWGAASLFLLHRAPDAHGFGANIFGILVFLGYYLVLEGSTGRTIGKMLTGTRVVDDAGRKPSWKKVLGRTLCRLIPFEAFGVFGGRRLAPHDTIPGTRVVRAARA